MKNSSINFIHMTDLHFSRSASYRIDDIMETLQDKFKQVKVYIKEYQAEAVFISGDIFNSNIGTKIGYDIVAEAVEMFKSLEVPCFGISGNHDLFLHNLNKHPLRVLFESGIIQKVGREGTRLNDKVVLFGFEHQYEKDLTQFDVSHWTEDKKSVKIGLTHLVLGEKPGFFYKEPQYGIEEFSNSGIGIFCNGHIHSPLGPLVNTRNQVFVQPGALRRTNTASEEISRIPQISLIEIGSEENPSIKTSYLPIKCRSDIFKDWKKEIRDEKKEELKEFISRVENIRNSNKLDLDTLIKEADLEPEVREVLESYLNEGT